MAVQGVKGTGIGQVVIPSAEEIVRGQQPQGILQNLAQYGEGLMSGTGPKAGEFLPVPDFAPEPQTRLGQLFDFPGIAESAARGARIVTGAPAVLTKTLGDFFSSPTEAGIQSEISRIESELSPFREKLRTEESSKRSGMSATPGLGTFTTAGGAETRPEEGFITSPGADVRDGDDLGTAATAEVEDEPAADLISSSMSEYLSIIGKDTGKKTTEEYIKEFSEATGLDVSGKPDNSTALMTLGLALMQNKAGRDFDVGNILKATGEAGEKAMPAFAKAKSEARALRAKAGEYALGKRDAYDKAAMQRTGFYIVPKSTGMTGRIKAFTEQSRRADLNPFELNALYENEKFRNQFDIIPASEYQDVYKELTKKPEYGDMYAGSYDKISLFDEAPDDLQIGVQRVNANYKGPNKPTRGYFNPGEYETYANRLTNMKSGLDKTADMLGQAYSIVKSGNVDAPGQIGDAISGFASAFGIRFTDEATPSAKVRRILAVLSAQEAPRILGEAGKTISDQDRVRVTQIVGELGMSKDPRDLALALSELYDRIVVGGYSDINEGFANLNMYAGITPSSQPTGFKRNKSGTFDATVE